jgi:amino acid permease
LCVGEIVLRTKGDHQLTGYAGKYLGGTGKQLMMAAMVIGNYGALLAYIIGEGQSLAELFGGNPWFWSITFFTVASLIIYRGIKAVGASELFLVSTKLGIFLVVVTLMVFSQVFDSSALTGFDLLLLVLISVKFSFLMELYCSPSLVLLPFLRLGER